MADTRNRLVAACRIAARIIQVGVFAFSLRSAWILDHLVFISAPNCTARFGEWPVFVFRCALVTVDIVLSWLLVFRGVAALRALLAIRRWPPGVRTLLALGCCAAMYAALLIAGCYAHFVSTLEIHCFSQPNQVTAIQNALITHGIRFSDIPHMPIITAPDSRTLRQTLLTYAKSHNCDLVDRGHVLIVMPHVQTNWRNEDRRD